MKLFLTGGFLGSGKTTAIQHACMQLIRQKVKAAVITNDQGNELVDTNYIKSFGIPVEEVPGGCFCCNYEKLSESILLLYRRENPDLIFAESVGSCTDLVATIAKPLAKYYPGLAVVISVFADASLLFSLISGTSLFLSDEVRYIYKKQLEEADILIVNKIDLLAKEELKLIRDVIESAYEDKTILYQDSTSEKDVQLWLTTMNNFTLDEKRVSLELDYDTYAKGEAMLAWLDETLDIHAGDGSAYEVAVKLITAIEANTRKLNYAIGHLKFLIDAGDTTQKISFTAINNEVKINDVHYLNTTSVSLVINARVQATPSQLEAVISNTIKEIAAQTNSSIIVNKLSAFRPGYPNPTYHIAN